MTRRTITPAMTRDIIYQQMAEGYVVNTGDRSFRLACAICGHSIDRMAKTVNEHMTPIELGGADDSTNIRIVHHGCAQKKTNGAAHVKTDGDASKIAKAKRLQKDQEAFERGEKKAAKMNGKGAKIPKRHDPWNTEYRQRMKQEGGL